MQTLLLDRRTQDILRSVPLSDGKTAYLVKFRGFYRYCVTLRGYDFVELARSI